MYLQKSSEWERKYLVIPKSGIFANLLGEGIGYLRKLSQRKNRVCTTSRNSVQSYFSNRCPNRHV
jgi:hypothetical protein